MNVELLEQTPARVAVAAPGGANLPGYGFEDSKLEPRGIHSEARWANRADLADLRGRTVCLQFEVRGAILYAFRWA